MKFRLAESDNNRKINVAQLKEDTSGDGCIWASDATSEYYYGMDKDELIGEIKSTTGIEEFERVYGSDIVEADDDDLRSFLMPNDIDLDYEDFEDNIMPMIENQCANDVLVLFGSAANWRGAREAGAVISVDEFKDYIYPDYEATSRICSDNGNLYYTQSSHDTPMGGTIMYLYSFKDNESYEKASSLCDEKTDSGEIEWQGDFKDDADYKEIRMAIDQGFLTPVRNTFNESFLTDSLEEANLTKAQRYNRDMNKIFDSKRRLDDAMKDFLIKNGVTEEEAEKLRQNDKLDIKLRELGLHDKFFNSWNKKECLEEGWYQFEFSDGSNPYIAKSEKERDKLLKKYKGKVEKIDDTSFKVTVDNNTPDLFNFNEDIKRYSDVADEQTKKRGWWYFTTHGVQPGSIPSDLNVLEVRDGQNEKGTNGTFVRLDGILNTSELKKYDMKEMSPRS